MPGHTRGKKNLRRVKGRPSPKPNPPSFGAKFRAAKPGTTFSHNGKKFARVTADQVKAAGYKTLREYLNAKNPKVIKPKVAKLGTKQRSRIAKPVPARPTRVAVNRKKSRGTKKTPASIRRVVSKRQSRASRT